MASMFWRLPVGRAGRTTAIRAISTLGVAVFLRRQPLKCDERPRATIDAPFARRHIPASPRTINQFATGSLAGLCTGVVLRLFSPVLALISGLVGLALLVASKYGFTARPVFQRIMRTSRMGNWSEAGEKFVFKLAFATTLVLAAFARF